MDMQFMDMPLQTQTRQVQTWKTEFKPAYSGGDAAVENDINALTLVKGEERYVFLYNESNRGETLRLLARFASNPDLSFTWYDAAVLSQKIRQERQRKTREEQLTANPRHYEPLPADELLR